MKVSGKIGLLGVGLALTLASGSAAALCNTGESVTDCVRRVGEERCASSSLKTLCKIKEAAKLLPEVTAHLADIVKGAIAGATDKARNVIAHAVARVMGNTEKVSDPKWTGEFCSKDAYFSRFKQDLSFDGLANVGVVKEGKVYRGSQPFLDGHADPSGHKGNGFDTLKKMGIKCRVLLRTTTLTDALRDERKELAQRDITLIHAPIPSLYFGPPKDSILGFKIPDSARILYTKAMTKARDTFMKAVQDCAGPVYVGCQSGKDRTGTLIGWYRAKVDGWKPDKIFREQDDCKYDPSGFFLYYRRVFCGWYKKEFGADPTCDAVLSGR